MLATPARRIALATSFGVAGYGVYRYSSYSKSTTPSTTHRPPFFELPVRARGIDGKVINEMKAISYLSKDEAERKLTENAFSATVPRAGSNAGGVWRFETAFLSSNDPIEDTNAQMVVTPSAKDGDFWGAKAPQSARDVLFFAIMDGHSGRNTSRLLAKTLIPSVALELQGLRPEHVQDSQYTHQPKVSWFGYMKSFVPFTSSSPAPTEYPFASDPKYVQTAIQTAFANLDSQIVNAPIKAIDVLTKGNKSLSASDLDPKAVDYQLAVATLLPAMSGACALMAMIDDAHDNLYVACTGDSRAVAGYWDVDKSGSGKWRVEVLTDDQTGRNPNEHKRIQSEHPADEASYVIQRGRVFGGLEPTRAFGDARYKWPKEFQQRLIQLFDDGGKSGLNVRRPPNDLKTPPYVTSRPEMTHRKLPPPSTSSGPGSSTLRFLVMATDGLWDQLSSAEVVSLVGEHLNRVSPTGTTPTGSPTAVPKSALHATTIETPRAAGSTSHAPSPDKSGAEDGAWAFVDKNVSTHLIRNALGGADEKRLHQLLSIPAPLSRRYRDDLTVTVVWWEEGQGAVKAKL